MPKSLLRSRNLLTAAWLLAAPSVIVAQSTPSLTAAERAIGSAVDSHNAEALALLERLVNINSGTMNFAGVRQVGDVLRAAVRRARLHDALGRRRSLPPRRPPRRRASGARARRYCSSGTSTRCSSRAVPFQTFERLNDSTARGPGIIDMKGGDVIIALRAARAEGRRRCSTA